MHLSFFIIFGYFLLSTFVSPYTPEDGSSGGKQATTGGSQEGNDGYTAQGGSDYAKYGAITASNGIMKMDKSKHLEDVDDICCGCVPEWCKASRCTEWQCPVCHIFPRPCPKKCPRNPKCPKACCSCRPEWCKDSRCTEWQCPICHIFPRPCPKKCPRNPKCPKPCCGCRPEWCKDSRCTEWQCPVCHIFPRPCPKKCLEPTCPKPSSL